MVPFGDLVYMKTLSSKINPPLCLLSFWKFSQPPHLILDPPVHFTSMGILPENSGKWSWPTWFHALFQKSIKCKLVTKAKRIRKYQRSMRYLLLFPVAYGCPMVARFSRNIVHEIQKYVCEIQKSVCENRKLFIWILKNCLWDSQNRFMTFRKIINEIKINWFMRFRNWFMKTTTTTTTTTTTVLWDLSDVLR